MEDASEFPTETIHHIFSYCSMKEEIVASMICKNWYIAYSTRPILKFNESELNFRYYPIFSQFITNTIQKHKAKLISIDEVCFNIFYTPDMVPYVHEWFDGIIRCSVKKLTFKSRSKKITLPKEAKSVQELSLSNCKLLHPGNANIMFQQLKRLKMTLVKFADGELLDKILSICSIIEDLEIDSCSPCQKITVGRNLENVKKLSLHTSGEDVPIDLHVPHNMVDLSLGGVLLSERIMDNFGKKFPQLLNLELHRCTSLQERLIFSSESLKSLVLGIIYGPKAIDLDIPYLLHFTHNLIDSWSIYSIIAPPKILPKVFIRCKEKVVAELHVACSTTLIDTSWFIRLRDLLLEHSPVATSRVSLKLVFGKRTTLKEVIGFVPGPLLEIDVLELDASARLPCAYSDLLLNGFLQFFRLNSVFIPNNFTWRFRLKPVNSIWKFLMERKCRDSCGCSYHLHGVEVMSLNSLGGYLQKTSMEAINASGYLGTICFKLKWNKG